MAWQTIIAALAGGALGIFAEFFGRIGANRQAAKQRQNMLQDEEIRHERDVSERRAGELRQMSREAIYQILDAIRDNTVALRDPHVAELTDLEVVQRALNIWRVLYRMYPSIADPQLRQRVHTCDIILDLATTPDVSVGRPIREVIFIVRNSLYDWLGPAIREEQLPNESEEWTALVDSLPHLSMDWQSYLRTFGVQGDSEERE